ncbi:Hypothetical protein FKW44_003710, partial [Caligus rogercresseyi]
MKNAGLIMQQHLHMEVVRSIAGVIVSPALTTSIIQESRRMSRYWRKQSDHRPVLAQIKCNKKK